MSLHAIVTYEFIPDIGSEDPWNDPRVLKALEEEVPKAKRKLDEEMKGWKPVAEGKETHYGINKNPIEFWYQRAYTK